jgi:hypothetical protein
VRPNASHQLSLGNGFTGALEQRDENIPRAAAQAKQRAAPPDYAIVSIQPEGSEFELTGVRALLNLFHSQLPGLTNEYRIYTDPTGPIERIIDLD